MLGAGGATGALAVLLFVAVAVAGAGAGGAGVLLLVLRLLGWDLRTTFRNSLTIRWSYEQRISSSRGAKKAGAAGCCSCWCCWCYCCGVAAAAAAAVIGYPNHIPQPVPHPLDLLDMAFAVSKDIISNSHPLRRVRVCYDTGTTMSENVRTPFYPYQYPSVP